MSGFHPVLGLLAVAVCISCSEGAPLSGILHNTGFRMSVRSERDAVPVPSAFYNKKKLAKRDDSQETNIIDDRNSENINHAAGIAKLKDLISRDGRDVLSRAEKGSGSGSLDDNTGESAGLVKDPNESKSEEESSSASEESGSVNPKESGGSDMRSVISDSQSEEECENEENNGGNAVSTSHPGDGEGSSTLSPHSSVSEDGTDESTITSNPTSPSNTEDEECEDTEPKRTTPPPTTTTTTTTTTTMKTTATEPKRESSSSEPVESSEGSQESQGSEECEDSVSPTPTRPRQRTTTTTKKPRDPDQSSGSFNDSDSEGLDFSDSYSKESQGRSTELGFK